jgi:hypothetical protein
VRSQDGDDEELELIQPEDFLPPNPFPSDAQRLGINQYTGGDAAFIALAANLDSRNPTHRAIAITLLLVFVSPLVLTVVSLLR